MALEHFRPHVKFLVHTMIVLLALALAARTAPAAPTSAPVSSSSSAPAASSSSAPAPTSAPAASSASASSAPAASSSSAPAASSSSAASSAAPVTLTFYYPVAVPGPITQIIDGYIAKFQAANPNIKVNAVLSGGYPDTLTKIQTTIKGGGTPPDVAVLLSTDLYSLVDSDAVLPLDDYVKAAGGDSFTSDFFPAYLANSNYQGKIWSLPFQRSIPVLYYNKDLFKAAGLDPNKPPTNYQEMVDAAKKLTKADGSQYGIEISSDGIPYWLFQSFVIGNGTNVVGKTANKVTFDDPAVAQALQDFVDLSAKHKVMPGDILLWANLPNDFVNGKAAMIWHSSGSLTNILKQAKFDVGVSYTVGSKGFGAPTGGGNMYILKGIPAANQAAAWKFIQFMTSTDIQADWSINTGYVPGRQSALNTQAMKDYVAKTPQAAVAPNGLKYAGAELATHNNAQIQKILGDAVQFALTGKLYPGEALKNAQSQANKILAPFKD
ncbi:MAG: ABC transporter substrate-binding protein [Chloroflexi bacterium]|nr:ABC transporter substrate-binding protein [Chloroflexota bacterium]